jgi:predicted RNA-binding protein with PUA-like domain
MSTVSTPLWYQAYQNRPVKGLGALAFGSVSPYFVTQLSAAAKGTLDMGLKYWLMKSDADVYSIDDLAAMPGQTDCWDGVRNYQARNFMREEMQVGDRVLFYHSGKNPSVVGIARVVKAGYPDHTAWDAKSDHPDPKSTPKNPIWYMVDIVLEQRFPQPIALKQLRATPGLESMMLLRKGMRLSIQPVTAEEFDVVVSLAGKMA